jgi:hypothetical protein
MTIQDVHKMVQMPSFPDMEPVLHRFIDLWFEEKKKIGWCDAQAIAYSLDKFKDKVDELLNLL